MQKKKFLLQKETEKIDSYVACKSWKRYKGTSLWLLQSHILAYSNNALSRYVEDDSHNTAVIFTRKNPCCVNKAHTIPWLTIRKLEGATKKPIETIPVTIVPSRPTQYTHNRWCSNFMPLGTYSL